MGLSSSDWLHQYRFERTLLWLTMAMIVALTINRDYSVVPALFINAIMFDRLRWRSLDKYHLALADEVAARLSPPDLWGR